MSSLTLMVTADVLAGAGERALDAVTSIFSNFRNIGYITFSKLFQTSFHQFLSIH